MTDSKSGAKRWVNTVCGPTSVHKILCLSIFHPHHGLVSYIKVLARRCNEILQAFPVKWSLFYPSVYRCDVRRTLSRRWNTHIIYKNLLHVFASAVKMTLACLIKNRSWLRKHQQRDSHIKIQHNIHTNTGCFTTLGHNCRRWFPRFLCSKNFI